MIGSIFEGLQLDRFGCRGSRRQALQHIGTGGPKALVEAAPLCWNTLSYNSVEIPLDSTTSISCVHIDCGLFPLIPTAFALS